FNPFSIIGPELAVSGFYLLRLLFYGSLIWIIPDLYPTERDLLGVVRLLVWVGMAVVIAGFLQLYVLPDIGILTAFGWDPHVGRLLSTFLDPNYLGGFLAILLAILLVFGREVSKL